MITGKRHTVARLPTVDARSDLDDRAGGAVARPEGELPVGHVRVLEPLVAAGIDGQLGAGADRTRLGGDDELALARRGQLDLADLDLVRLDNGTLTNFHKTGR